MSWISAWNFHRPLSRYVNRGGVGPTDFLLSLLPGGLAYRRNAPRIVELHRSCRESIRCSEDLQPKTVRTARYSGSNVHVRRMSAYLSERLPGALVGAWVHGSLATGEELPFSDFDALVILRDRIFDSPNRLATTARALGKAAEIMLDFDPLQHHGWFVLAETQLQGFPGHYFPTGLFDHAESILPEGARELELQVHQGWALRAEALEALCTAVIEQTSGDHRPTNLYRLKSFLSEFMLLPTLYVQIRDREDVFKGESFDLARHDFSANLWAPMDEASKIRQEWGVDIPRFLRPILGRSSQPARYLSARIAPAIPVEINERLSEEFYVGVAALARELRDAGRRYAPESSYEPKPLSCP